MPLRNIRDYYRLRGFYPGPLVYPYTAMSGFIPLPVLDRLSFRAFESQRQGDCVGVFVVRAWEEFRYPHLTVLHSLLDLGIVRRACISMGFESWDWSYRVALRTAPSVSEVGTQERANNGFFDPLETSEFSPSVVVAPRISPTCSTPL